MARVLAESFNAIGIRVLTGAQVVGVQRRDGRLEAQLADGRSLVAEKVLFAAGRRSCTDSLGPAHAGVETDARGWVRVDERYATTAQGVYAAGDLIGPPGLASVAMEQARVAHFIDATFAVPTRSEAYKYAAYDGLMRLERRGRCVT